MHSPRKRILVAAAAAGAALTIAPAIASAQDFCVGGPAGCSGTAVAANNLAGALTTAQANGSDDRFFLAPGTFSAGKFVYVSAERLQLIGAGAGKTILRGNLANESVLTLSGNQDTSVSDLTIQPTGSVSSGLTLQGTSAHRVTVDAKSIASLVAGVELFADATFDHGSVEMGTLAQPAVGVFSGAGTVTDSSLNAPAGAGFVGGGSEATLRRSTVRAIYGVIVGRGHLTASDTLVDLRGNGAGSPLAAGLSADPHAGGNGSTTATADADRLTIVASTPPPGTTTAGIVAQADGAGLNTAVHVRDSVVSGVQVPVARQAANGGTANITTSRSAYPVPVTSVDSGAGSIVEQGRLKVSPHFVDAAGGDFHLAADSPLIDAGTPGAVGDDATDRDGAPRVSDGNGDCSRVSDIGAFEYQGTTVHAAAAAAASAATGQAVGFSAAGSCIPGPGAPSIAWSFDDGATASGAAVSHAFGSAGRHTATVTVSDGHGHQASATAPVDVSAPAGPSGTPAGPHISRLRVAPQRVRIGTALPALARGAVKKPLAAIRFQLDERATVTLRFSRLGAHGAARTVKGKVTIKARKGGNVVRFAGRLNHRIALKPGTYRLIAVAKDASGARSKRVQTRFTAIARSGQR